MHGSSHSGLALSGSIGRPGREARDDVPDDLLHHLGRVSGQALDVVTGHPTWRTRPEVKTGSIELGKRADLVVLDPDITAAEAREISGIKVLGTVMDRRLTLRDGI